MNATLLRDPHPIECRIFLISQLPPIEVPGPLGVMYAQRRSSDRHDFEIEFDFRLLVAPGQYRLRYRGVERDIQITESRLDRLRGDWL